MYSDLDMRSGEDGFMWSAVILHTPAAQAVGISLKQQEQEDGEGQVERLECRVAEAT